MNEFNSNSRAGQKYAETRLSKLSNVNEHWLNRE